MLITLQSDNDSNCNDFTNYFKETIGIEPNSDLALVNCSYKYKNSIIVNGSNNTFDLSLGSNDLSTVTCSTGEYNDDTFLDALNSGLSTFFDSADYRLQQAFPKLSNVFSYTDQTKDKLQLKLQYNPKNWDGALVDKTATTVRQQINLSNQDMMTVALGEVNEFNSGGVYNVDNWNAGTSTIDADTNNIWATAKDNQNAVSHGEVVFDIEQQSAELIVGLSEVIPIDFEADTSCMLKFDSGTSFKIFEKDTASSIQAITDNITYDAGDTFKIILDQTNVDGNIKYPRYYQNDTEITNFVGGADRFKLRPELKMKPCGSFKTVGGAISGLSYDVVQNSIDEPLTKHIECEFSPSTGFKDLTGLNHTNNIAPLDIISTGTAKLGKESDIMLINIDQFQIKSICKNGGIQKAIASISYGQNSPYQGGDTGDGQYYYEPKSLIYHKLENSGVENHNQLRVRLTDAIGEPLQQLLHPTTITLDLKPRAS